MKHALLSLLLTTSAFAADPLFDQQWGLKNSGQKIYRAEGEIRREQIAGVTGADIEWPGLEKLNELGAGREVIVAVIDSGIDMTHPEFQGRLYEGKDFLDEAEMKDDTGHGTHVAGIIAANADGVGTQGVTPKAIKILPLKVLNKNTNGFVYKNRMITDIIADAIAYAVEAGASVINMSLGWPQLVNTPKIIRALDIAASRGIVLVAAAGNNNKDVPTWPCAHSSVICVGAMDNQGKLAEFSNHGGKVDLVAPGEWIVSAHPKDQESRTLRIQGYEAKNGSSQAAPFVAAAAAVLKLQDETLSAQQIKARLYSSAKPMKEDADKRFVRFGSLALDSALSSSKVNLASVNVKNLVTIDVADNGFFDFALPLEILGESQEQIQAEISGLEANVEVIGNNLRVFGRLEDFSRDSEVPVRFKITQDQASVETSITLSFARKIDADNFLSTSIPSIPGNALVAIQGERKMSRMGMVSVESTPSSDFHGYIQAKSENEIRVISVRANAGDVEARLSDITLTDHHQLLSVFERDINFDGVNEMIYYGMNTRRDHLVLTFKTLEGEDALGENSRWEMPITTFEGLPLKDGERADFSWIRLQTFLGELSVPYYQKAWLMPEEDNSRDLLDYETPGVMPRLYYLEPYKLEEKVLIRPRVVDSVSLKQDLEASISPRPWESVVIERILPQSQEERRAGSVRHVVSVGQDFFRRFSILTVDKVGQYKIEDHADSDVFQVGNMSLVTRRLEDFSVSKNSFQMALLDRSSARVKPFIQGRATNAWTLLTSGWSNPFFEIVATFEGQNRRTLFFESRYHVYVYDQEGDNTPVASRLPINRDSSFPGVNFSETLQSVLVRDENGNQPAVAVNSTLIYGDRLYTMVSRKQTLTRPVSLSVKVPANCVPIKSQMLTSSQGFSAYAMLCQKSAQQVDLAFFPLELK